LEWRPPKRAVEVVPQRCLLPVTVSEVFSPATPFPPDDRSIGYERGTSISKAWDDASTEAAIESAGSVASRRSEPAAASDGAADREIKVKAFCRQFVEKAFRSPLQEPLVQTYVDRQFKGVASLETGVKKVVLLALLSPRFLYAETGGPSSNPYSVASRLSFELWDSIPDQELLKAAASGQLATKEQVAAQAERMVSDRRAWFKIRQFFLQWLKVDSYPDLAKDPKQFPGFDMAAASDLRTSL